MDYENRAEPDPYMIHHHEAWTVVGELATEFPQTSIRDLLWAVMDPVLTRAFVCSVNGDDVHSDKIRQSVFDVTMLAIDETLPMLKEAIPTSKRETDLEGVLGNTAEPFCTQVEEFVKEQYPKETTLTGTMLEIERWAILPIGRLVEFAAANKWDSDKLLRELEALTEKILSVTREVYPKELMQIRKN